MSVEKKRERGLDTTEGDDKSKGEGAEEAANERGLRERTRVLEIIATRT